MKLNSMAPFERSVVVRAFKLDRFLYKIGKTFM
jgi:hypothetical protein